MILAESGFLAESKISLAVLLTFRASPARAEVTRVLFRGLPRKKCTFRAPWRSCVCRVHSDPMKDALVLSEKRRDGDGAE